MTRRTPILGATLPAREPLGRWRRARWLAFLLSMLAFNAYPISDLVHRGYVGWAVVGILAVEVVFGALWVWVSWLAMATTRDFPAIAPWFYAVVGLGVGMALVLGGGYRGLTIYVSIACAVALPLRWTIPAIVGATVVDGLALLRNPRYSDFAHGFDLNGVVTSLSLTFFLGLMMWFYRRVMLLVGELHDAREELARLAVTEERLRFARDLHDLLGHSLTTIALKSQVARRLAVPESRAAVEVADIETVAQQALAEVREAVTGYRATTLADELDTARGALAAAGIDVTVDVTGTPLPARVDALLGWVVREGTTNVLRHSRANTCTFQVRRDGDTVALDIADDGVGVVSVDGRSSVGNGLAGLAERVAGAGGRLDSGPLAGQGFRLAARLPLSQGWVS
jgi:two-component system sensor histidine kinase DesK